ncbi:MAG: protein kinase [Deltaproteobacteria bacterium]|nr:protein kinase [Deltaproteobacteria bacterium]
MAAVDFVGTPRFRVLSRLGQGGMGVVYRAHDEERGVDVALKTLHKLDAGGLYRLKQEFRSLADVSHPNLVALHELVVEGDQVFFTMDLVEGSDLVEHVRSGGRGADAAPAEWNFSTVTAGQPAPERVTPGAGPASAPVRARGLELDVGRLRAVLTQLVAGVRALHAAGKLHRDIKPSNMLVTPDGRVVLLDFGLVSQRRHGVSGDRGLMGTPAYMSPEQAQEQPLGPASDWYSVGVVLFEALTGVLPFRGAVTEVLAAKARFPALSPAQLAPDAPEDLVELCEELLRIEPERRPTGEDIARRLGGERVVERALGAPSGLDEGEPPLIGRDAELAALASALAEVRAGEPVVVWAHGRSGIGKSTLIEQFLAESGALVLAGRCYERESVPYKALDGVIDALSVQLGKLEPGLLRSVLPAEGWLLARLFPVLRRVAGLESARVGAGAGAAAEVARDPDPQELRRRGAVALRELMAGLARVGPVVVHIDDLQWGDLDSAALLEELLAAPGAPGLLLLASYRREDAGSSVCLAALGAPGSAGPQRLARTRELPVEPLAPSALEALLEVLLPDAPPGRRAAIAVEADGSPLLAGELARWHRERGAGMTAATLVEVLGARCERLPAPARTLLEVVALGGRPLQRAVAARAAGLEDAQGPLAMLSKSRLLRLQGGDAETFHDRVREIVAQALPAPRRRALHLALATALSEQGGAEPEFLGAHHDGAGDSRRAGELYATAATAAHQALAFERAARLYRMALERTAEAALVPAGPSTSTERLRLQIGLGEALAGAGQGGRAAAALLDAAAASAGDEALELRRRAAEQQLKAGLIPEGIETMSAVLGSVGLAVPRRPGRALMSLLWRRARVRLRGLDFVQRAEPEVPAPRRVLIDTCWSMAIGLGMVDPIRGSDFGARHLLLALDAGEPRRIARALGLEAAYRAIEPGGRAASRSLLATARTLAGELGDPHVSGLVRLLGATTAYVSGEPAPALELARQAEAELRARCVGVSWELSQAQVFAIASLILLGRVREVREALTRGIHDARSRGDRYLEIGLRGAFGSIPYLASGDIGAGERDLDDAMAVWGAPGEQRFHMQHCYDVLSRCTFDLLRGHGAGAPALRRLDEAWPQFKRSFLLRAQVVRCFLLDMDGRIAVLAAQGGVSGALPRAQRAARLLRREGLALATTWAAAMEAGIASVKGDPEATRVALERAAALAAEAGFTMIAACVNDRLGQLLGGDAGAALRARAETWARSEDIPTLSHFARVLTPGFD